MENSEIEREHQDTLSRLAMRPPVPVPPTLTRCSVCNQHKGTVAYKHVPGSVASELHPDTPIPVECICAGVLCRRCKSKWFHRPISNFWNEQEGIIHVPSSRG